MKIFIPTYGRADRQVTWDNLPHSAKFITELVVQKRDEDNYDTSKYPLIVLPPEIQDIGKTRQWLIDHTDDYMIMLDDDLDFATRRTDDEPTKFRPSTDVDTHNMLNGILTSLRMGFVMVGVSCREGANYDVSAFKDCSRQLRVHGIDPKKFRELGIRFDRLQFMEDFDATLQLLELGYANTVLNHWVHNQRGGSNAPGGCSASRTLEKHNEAAKELKQLHPSFVKVVEKDSGNWGAPRLDVNIQWKKAYEYGKSKRLASLLDSRAGERPQS